MNHIFEINSNSKPGSVNQVDKNCTDCDEWVSPPCENEGCEGREVNCKSNIGEACTVSQDSSCKECNEWICITCDNEPPCKDCEEWFCITCDNEPS